MDTVNIIILAAKLTRQPLLLPGTGSETWKLEIRVNMSVSRCLLLQL